MTTKGPLSRFAFYWNEQRGRCALMITDACRTHGGQMTTDKLKGGRQRPSHATWDHIYPKPRTAEQEPIQVLACAACNNKRGNAPARAEYVARGLVLHEEWRKLEESRAGVIGVKKARRRVKYEQRRIVRSHQLAEREAERTAALKAMQAEVDAPKPNTQKHPKIPLGSPGAQMMATLSRAERNAESQAAALKGIAERMKAQGQHKQSKAVSDKAAAILAAVRGDKPPERK